MLRMNMICVGSCKEPYLRDGCAEYLKRLTTSCHCNVVEIPPAPLTKKPSAREIARALLLESRAILRQIESGGYHYALCVEGKSLDSPAFSAHIAARAVGGESTLNFIIGGSHGIADEVKRQAHLRFSLSAMTFPHQLARLLLLEQIYRAFQISDGGQYHK